MNWFYLLLKRGILLILLSGSAIYSYAQQSQSDFSTPSHLGMTGLVYTPSAYMPKWGTLDFGFTHFHKNASLTFEAGESAERTFLSSVTFLPFLELSLRITKPYSKVNSDSYGIGDRSISLRAQVLKERKYVPAIVIGTQDPFAYQAFFNTNYLVLTKKYSFKKINVVTNLGYGVSFEEEARGDYLQGVFGGIQVHWQTLHSSLEYDTNHFNFGFGYQLKEFLFLKAALVNGQYFTGNINLRFFIR